MLSAKKNRTCETIKCSIIQEKHYKAKGSSKVLNLFSKIHIMFSWEKHG